MLKRNLIAVAIILLLSVGANAQRTTVTVNGGSGGTYRGAKSVHIWANPPASGQIFDHWSGDTRLLQQPFESPMKVNLIQRNVTLTAVYRSAAAWTQTNLLVNNSLWAYYFPPNHVGVIFRFHGSGGNQGTFWGNAEDRDFASRAVAAGYAVVAGNSADRVNKQWDSVNPQGSNQDIASIVAVVTQLRRQGLMTATDPIFSVGFSNGGTFASYIANLSNWRAAAIYCSPPGSWEATTTVPHIFNMAVNDLTLEPTIVSFSQAVYANLISRGVPAQYNDFFPSPVYPDRFWRINPLTSADPHNIYNALKQNGFLDGNDYFIRNPRTSGWEAVIPAQYQSQLDEIEWQMHVAYVDHVFMSDANYRTPQFFNARL